MKKTVFWLAVLIMSINCLALYSVADIEEDSAAWNCLLHGNNICGTAPNFLGFIY